MIHGVLLGNNLHRTIKNHHPRIFSALPIESVTQKKERAREPETRPHDFLSASVHTWSHAQKGVANINRFTGKKLLHHKWATSIQTTTPIFTRLHCAAFLHVPDPIPEKPCASVAHLSLSNCAFGNVFLHTDPNILTEVSTQLIFHPNFDLSSKSCLNSIHSTFHI